MAGIRDVIDTVVLVMMENRSFDHVLGFLSHEWFDGRTDVDGLHLHGPTFDWDNQDANGNLYPPTLTPDSYLPADLPHLRTEVTKQMAQGAMTGFIEAYFAAQTNDRSPVPMRFCRPDDIPMTAMLARSYCVCDRWFAAVPADTWPNRLMSLCGYTRIDSTDGIKPPFHLLPDQYTIFDWLANGKDFHIYVDAASIANVGPPSGLLLMKSQWGHLAGHASPLVNLGDDWNSGGPAPDFIYCEPFYNDFATALGMHGGCNHPPLPMAYGEAFLAKVYRALTSNPDRWKRTLLIVCYDEHGGLFDHVSPPTMRYNAPAGNGWLDPAPMATLGVRVPGIVISPAIGQRTCFKGLLDHTSIQQLLVDRFGSPSDLASFGVAAQRKANGVGSLASLPWLDTPRCDVPPVPPLPSQPPAVATTPPVSNVGVMFRGVMADHPVPGAR
jgi:phospholipase C